MTSQQLEERLSSLEQEVVQLKNLIIKPDAPSSKPEKWWHKIAGSAANDPTFDEAEQLGDRENTVMGHVATSVKSIASIVIKESLPDEENSLVIGHCLCRN